MNDFKNRFFGCWFGAIIGDVLGAPYEFKPAGDFHFDGRMTAGGPFNLKKGYYTDDTSMMLAMTDSIITHNKVDAVSQTCNYLEWYRNGKYSSTGHCFDIGYQTASSLEYFERNNTFAEKSTKAGNGALMRIAGAVLFNVHNKDNKSFNESIKQTVITTHNSDESIVYTTRYAHFVKDVLNTNDIVLDNIRSVVHNYEYGEDFEANGYIITSYFAALRSFFNNGNFEDCMYDIINIGGDTDTNACIAGMLAGAHYGFDGIRHDWLKDLHNYEYLYDMCEQLYNLVQSNKE